MYIISQKTCYLMLVRVFHAALVDFYLDLVRKYETLFDILYKIPQVSLI